MLIRAITWFRNRGKPSLVQLSNKNKGGRADYLKRVPLWQKYPRLFIVGGGSVVGCLPWAYPVYTGFFVAPEDYPPPEARADWWPSEIMKGKRTIDQVREQRAKVALWKEEYERDMKEKKEAQEMLKKVKTN